MRFHKTALFSKTGNLLSTDARPNLDEPLLSAHQFNPGGWTGGGTKVLQQPDRKEDEAQMCATVLNAREVTTAKTKHNTIKICTFRGVSAAARLSQLNRREGFKNKTKERQTLTRLASAVLNIAKLQPAPSDNAVCKRQNR